MNIPSDDLNIAAQILSKGSGNASAEEAPPAEAKPETEPPQEEPATEEPKKEPEASPDDKSNDRLSKSWAAISKRESQVRQALRDIESKTSELQGMQSELLELRRLRDSIKSDPVSFMDQHYGPDWYSKATQRFINDPKGAPSSDERIAALEAKLEATVKDRDKWLEEQWEKRERAKAEVDKGQQQAAQYLEEAKRLIDTDDRFEVTRNTKNYMGIIEELVAGYYQQHGVLLSQEEAATLVEEELLEDTKTRLKANKLRSVLSEITEPEKKTKKHDGSPKTLTDKLSGASSSNGQREETLTERMHAAAKLLVQMNRQERA